MTARRTDHMEYMDGMEALDSDILNKVIHAMDHYDPNTFTETHVRTALSHDIPPRRRTFSGGNGTGCPG